MTGPTRTSRHADVHEAETLGLRDRKKARRREEIIAVARDLFARQGIDATTMTEIAAGADVSPPTVFNYFESKDGILIAMIDEGARTARENDAHTPGPEGADLNVLIVDLFTRITARTLDIAGKRVWRYAEAAVIRHPQAELGRTYRQVSADLLAAVTGFLDGFELRTRSGQPCPADWLGRVLHDVWMPCFIDLITDDAMTLEQYEQHLRQRMVPLIELLFDDACIAKPERKTTRTNP